MKTLVRLLVIAIVLGIVREHIRWEQFLLPVRVVRLAAEPPDAVLTVPVVGVRPASIANTWHASRSGGRKHEGQDIFARRGTPVVAAADGVVVRLGGGALGGNAVFVSGRGARTYYYAHLDRYASGLATGSFVLQGQVLGFVGNTGNARTTPPHLHFGIYSVQGALDPLPLLAQARPASSGSNVPNIS